MRCYTKSKTDLFCNKCLACIKMCMAMLFTAEIIGTLTKPPTLLTKYGSDIFFCCLPLCIWRLPGTAGRKYAV